VAGCYENITEHMGSIKCREFLDQLRNYWLLKDYSMECISFLLSSKEQFYAQEIRLKLLE
jgi:hypothetical protein